jgi:hypothetical protein
MYQERWDLDEHVSRGNLKLFELWSKHWGLSL